MKLGILGTADIAFRRFLPALKKCPHITYAGVASRTPQKGIKFQEAFGGEIYSSYDELLADDSIDAVYVPLPPALHFAWGKKVLDSGKHLLMEKPFTTSAAETETLLQLAAQKGLAVHENYMFLYHSQLAHIRQLVTQGELGDIRLYRMAFGFPMRGKEDFRYQKQLGGGALLDCGGYPVRLALEILGETTQVVQSRLVIPEDFDLDLYGNAVLENRFGQTAQISFGMDNAYQCQLEIWGSKATLIAPRIFTAGDGFSPALTIRTSSDEHSMTLAADDQFLHSIEAFVKTAEQTDRSESRALIQKQSKLVEQIQTKEYTL